MATTPKPKKKQPARKRKPAAKGHVKRTSWKPGQSGSPETVIKAGEIKNPEGANQYGGKDGKYRKEFAAIAKKMCDLGATNHDLAEALGVTDRTIELWLSKHADFAEAAKVSKDAYDARVERSMAIRAMGYTFEEEKLFCDKGEVIRAKTLKHVPADVSAAKHWLAVRRRDTWTNPDKVEITGKDGGPIETESRSDLEVARRIAFALAKADREREDNVIEHDGSA